MPVDIAMGKELLTRRKNAGYAAICAVGLETDPGVFRLATAENVEAHIPQLQPGRWEPLHFARLLWTPGMAVARTMVTGAEKFLAETGHSLGQRWHRAPLDLLDDLLTAEAVRLNARTWTHSELIIRLKRQAKAQADSFAAGRF